MQHRRTHMPKSKVLTALIFSLLSSTAGAQTLYQAPVFSDGEIPVTASTVAQAKTNSNYQTLDLVQIPNIGVHPSFGFFGGYDYMNPTGSNGEEGSIDIVHGFTCAKHNWAIGTAQPGGCDILWLTGRSANGDMDLITGNIAVGPPGGYISGNETVLSRFVPNTNGSGLVVNTQFHVYFGSIETGLTGAASAGGLAVTTMVGRIDAGLSFYEMPGSSIGCAITFNGACEVQARQETDIPERWTKNEDDTDLDHADLATLREELKQNRMILRQLVAALAPGTGHGLIALRGDEPRRTAMSADERRMETAYLRLTAIGTQKICTATTPRGDTSGT
jgi:hypothetical protein